MPPAPHSLPKKYTGNSFKFGKVPNPYFEKFQVNKVGCGVAVVGTSQPPRKSIPAIVLNLERSVGGLRISSVFWLVREVDATGISRHPEKIIPAIVLNLERSVGVFENFKCVYGDAVAWMPPAPHSLQKKVYRQ